MALISWLSVRAQGGAYIWRIEDIDGPRVIPGAAEQQMHEAQWLGLDWDEGPQIGGPYSPYEQSKRSSHYERALEQLASSERLFPCTFSRKDLKALASAPHGNDWLPPYPTELRPKQLPVNWFEEFNSSDERDSALRFRVDEGATSFRDLVQGLVTENVSTAVGDFVLKRRDGVYAYQLAVVVDDIEMGITEVVRGADLLDSTARQIQLLEALGGSVRTYAHLPLIVDEIGEKLSKRNESLTISQLRTQGVSPSAIVGWLANIIGLTDELQPNHPNGLIEAFSWDRVRRDEITVSDDLPEQLARFAA